MNATLFRSPHFFWATGICVGFVVYLFVIDASIGAREGSDVDYVLWSGWTALALMVVAMLYCARKYMHKRAYSPEMKKRVPMDVLERTDRRLNEIRRKIAQGFLSSAKEISNLANRVLVEEGASRVIKIVVKEGDESKGEPRFDLQAVPPERFGRMTVWLHIHCFYGLASGVLVWLHGGGSMDSLLGIAMNVLTAIVVVTGIVGWFLFARGPTWFTRAETDMNFEETFVLNQSLSEKIETLFEKFEPPAKPDGSEEDGPSVADWEKERDAIAEVRSELRRVAKSRANVAAKLEKSVETCVARKPEFEALIQDAAVLIGQRARMRAGLAELNRIKFWMNVWRAVHVPASILLFGIVILHVWAVWWY